MELKHTAMAGTLESSDVLVTVNPGENGVELELSSNVFSQFGKQIKATVLETLDMLGVKNARVQCAVFRAADQKEGFPWGGRIK